VYIREQDWQLLSVGNGILRRQGRKEVPCRTREYSARNPHHVDANPHPSFHFHKGTDPTFLFNADPDPAPRQRDANLRPPVCRTSINPF
jgi:hypothetical protein